MSNHPDNVPVPRGRMKPGPFQQLLAEAESLGIQTQGFTNEAASVARLEEKIAAHPRSSTRARGGLVSRKTTIEMPGIPKFSHADAGTEQFARECMHYLLELVDWECAGKPQDLDPKTPESLRVEVPSSGNVPSSLAGRIRLMAGEIVRTRKERAARETRQVRR